MPVRGHVQRCLNKLGWRALRLHTFPNVVWQTRVRNRTLAIHRLPGAGHRANQRRHHQRDAAGRHSGRTFLAEQQPARCNSAATGAQAVPAAQDAGRVRAKAGAHRNGFAGGSHPHDARLTMTRTLVALRLRCHQVCKPDGVRQLLASAQARKHAGACWVRAYPPLASRVRLAATESLAGGGRDTWQPGHSQRRVGRPERPERDGRHNASARRRAVGICIGGEETLPAFVVATPGFAECPEQLAIPRPGGWFDCSYNGPITAARPYRCSLFQPSVTL